MSGVDAASFVLDATNIPNVEGEQRHLRFRSAPDYEEPADDNGDNVYKVTLVATDNSNATAERDITVFVMNDDEPGKVTLSDEQPIVGTELTATLEDEDAGVHIITWQWSKSESREDDDDFENIDGATSGSFDVSAYTPVGADETSYLRATVSYTDVHSPQDDPATVGVDERFVTPEPNTEPQVNTVGKTLSATSKFAVRVPAEDANPEFESSTYRREVAENAEHLTLVGDPIPMNGIITEVDLLVGTSSSDKEHFSIDINGQIRVKGLAFPPTGTAIGGVYTDPRLDFESKREYSLVVTAYGEHPVDQNEARATATTNVVVSLVDLNEQPWFTATSRGPDAVSFSENGTGVIEHYEATDDDNTLRWDVKGPNAPLFTIADGRLQFVDPPDFEAPGDLDGSRDVPSNDLRGHTEGR